MSLFAQGDLALLAHGLYLSYCRNNTGAAGEVERREAEGERVRG